MYVYVTECVFLLLLLPYTEIQSEKNKKTLQILEVTLDAQVMAQSEIHVWNWDRPVYAWECTHGYESTTGLEAVIQPVMEVIQELYFQYE